MRRDKSEMQMNDMKTLRHLELIIDGLTMEPLCMESGSEMLLGEGNRATVD